MLKQDEVTLIIAQYLSLYRVKALSEHDSAGDINRLLELPKAELSTVVADIITARRTEHPYPVNSFGA